jgi:hypothetical protein
MGVRSALENSGTSFTVPGDLSPEHWSHVGIGVSIYMHRSGVVLFEAGEDRIVTDADTLDHMNTARAAFFGDPGPVTVSSEEADRSDAVDRGEGVETDGGTETQGAIDREFDDAEQSYDDRVAEALADVPTEPLEQGVAIDIVTRQAVYIRQQVAATCREYYHENSFDLVTYKMHPWLPGISAENAVYECVYIDGNPQNAHKPGKTYDFPSARLLPLPLPMAWDAFEVGEL